MEKKTLSVVRLLQLVVVVVMVAVKPVAWVKLKVRCFGPLSWVLRTKRLQLKHMRTLTRAHFCFHMVCRFLQCAAISPSLDTELRSHTDGAGANIYARINKQLKNI
jgi:hypothetical protein